MGEAKGWSTQTGDSRYRQAEQRPDSVLGQCPTWVGVEAPADQTKLSYLVRGTASGKKNKRLRLYLQYWLFKVLTDSFRHATHVVRNFGHSLSQTIGQRFHCAGDIPYGAPQGIYKGVYLKKQETNTLKKCYSSKNCDQDFSRNIRMLKKKKKKV